MEVAPAVYTSLIAQTRVAGYIGVSSLAAFVLEWLFSVEEEVQMRQRIRLNAAILTCYLSRFTTLAFVITHIIENAIVFNVVGGRRPPLLSPVFLAGTGLWWLSSAFASLLFFLRVRAVFSLSPVAKGIFSALWLVVGVVPVPLLWSGWGPHCLYKGSNITFESCPGYTSLSLLLIIAIVCHDTLLFVCLSRELGQNSSAGAHSFRAMFTGYGLHPVSKSLLRTGQLYYGVTMGTILVAAITFWTNSIWFIVTGIIHQTVWCTLSCRVFRMVLLRENEQSPSKEIRTEQVEEMIMAVMNRADAAEFKS